MIEPYELIEKEDLCLNGFKMKNEESDFKSWDRVPTDIKVIVLSFLLGSQSVTDMLTFRLLHKKSRAFFDNFITTVSSKWLLNYIEDNFYEPLKVKTVINFCKKSKCIELRWSEHMKRYNKVNSLDYLANAFLIDDINSLVLEDLQEHIAIVEQDARYSLSKVMTSLKLQAKVLEYGAKEYSTSSESIRLKWKSEFITLQKSILKVESTPGPNQLNNFMVGNFGYLNLSKANLENVILQKARLGFVNLEGAVLSGARFVRVEFFRVNLRHANLIGAAFGDCTLVETDATQANLTKGQFNRDTRAVKTNFSNAKFNEITFYCFFTNQCDFRNSVFSGRKALYLSDYIEVDDEESNFEGSHWSSSIITGSLRKSSFCNAIFDSVEIKAFLRKTNFSEATMIEPIFISAHAFISLQEKAKHKPDNPPIFKDTTIHIRFKALSEIKDTFGNEFFKDAKLVLPTLTKEDFMRALKLYDKYKASFFGLRKLATSELSKYAREDLMKVASDEQRHDSALTYIENNPKTAFAHALFAVMPQETRQKLLSKEEFSNVKLDEFATLSMKKM